MKRIRPEDAQQPLGAGGGHSDAHWPSSRCAAPLQLIRESEAERKADREMVKTAMGTFEPKLSIQLHSTRATSGRKAVLFSASHFLYRNLPPAAERARVGVGELTHRSSASSVGVHSHVHTRTVRCVYFCVCEHLCPGGSVSSLQVNHNQSVQSWKGVQGDLGEAWPNHCKCHEWDRKACINNSVPSKSKTTKPKIMFGLLHWQSPVTYQNTGLCRATVGWCTWPTLGFGTSMKPVTVTHWYWEKSSLMKSSALMRNYKEDGR